MLFSLDSIFTKNISDFNFYINKLNFISYYIPYLNNEISNSYDFLSIPFKYINNVYNLINNNIKNKDICYSIYTELKKEIGINNFNFIFDDNYSKNSRTPLIKYISDIEYINLNNGFLFNNNYINNIYYNNKYSKILKNNDDHFYFYKNQTINSEPFQWIGIYIDNLNNKNIFNDNITIQFYIKLIKDINYIENINYGIKTHEPINYYKEWIKDCIINKYVKIELNIKILKKNQYIIFNFDNYNDEIEFYIKNFKIIMDY
jgi:hypothetical protein